MDIQTYLNNAVAASRAETLAKSDQLTLGEMILKLEPIIAKHAERDSPLEVRFDFEYLYPTGIESWRGSYNELALTFSCSDRYDGSKAMNIIEFTNMLKQSIGKTFKGYKGGDFIMSKHTPVWVANHGNSGNTAVVEIVDAGYMVLIITGYRDF